MKPMHFILTFIFGAALAGDALAGSVISATGASTIPSLASRGREITRSVYRIICPNGFGTGFLHKSGKVLTAYHVVQNCPNPIARSYAGQNFPLTVQAVDGDLDIAVLGSTTPISGSPIPIESGDNLEVGKEVATWGFPAGYPGDAPLLSVGYLSGQIDFQTSQGSKFQQWVVNAAFNSGNSGGPLIDVDSGTVIGIVDSKLAPISPQAVSALAALQQSPNGLIFQAVGPDGNPFNASEAQVVAVVLDELRRQTQLVIGMAIRAQDIRNFLASQNIDP